MWPEEIWSKQTSSYFTLFFLKTIKKKLYAGDFYPTNLLHLLLLLALDLGQLHLVHGSLALQSILFGG